MLTDTDKELLLNWRDFQAQLNPKDLGIPRHEIEWILCQIAFIHAMDLFSFVDFVMENFPTINKNRLNYWINKKMKTRGLNYLGYNLD